MRGRVPAFVTAAVLLLASCGGSTQGSSDTTSDTTGVTTSTAAAATTTPVPDLAGTSWEVVDYALADGTITNVWPDTEVTIVFGGDGTVSGSTGCNDYSGAYVTEGRYDPLQGGVPDPNDGQAISFGPLAATEMACTPEHVMEQEAEFLALLARTGRWVIAGVNLNLRSDDGSFLIEAEPRG